MIRREGLQFGSDSSDEDTDDQNLSWRTASAGPTPVKAVEEDLDKTVTSFLERKYNFSPQGSPTLARAGPSRAEIRTPDRPVPQGQATRPPLQPRAPQPLRSVLRPPILRAPVLPGPALPPELDKAFSDLGATGGRETRSKTGPLPKEVLHRFPPERRPKK